MHDFCNENGSSKKVKIVSHCESKTGIRKKFSFSIIFGFSRSFVAFRTCVIFDFLIFDSDRSSCAPRYKNGKTSDGEFDLKINKHLFSSHLIEASRIC